MIYATILICHLRMPCTPKTAIEAIRVYAPISICTADPNSLPISIAGKRLTGRQIKVVCK
jgi:hypothetical protein